MYRCFKSVLSSSRSGRPDGRQCGLVTRVLFVFSLPLKTLSRLEPCEILFFRRKNAISFQPEEKSMPKLIMLSLIFITMSNTICVLLREVRCLGQKFFCLMLLFHHLIFISVSYYLI